MLWVKPGRPADLVFKNVRVEEIDGVDEVRIVELQEAAA